MTLAVFGTYLEWVDLCVIILYLISILLFQLQEYNKGFLLSSGERHATLLGADQKFLLVPAVFMVLRVWDVLYGIMFLYTNINGRHKWLIYLDVSVYCCVCLCVCVCACMRVAAAALALTVWWRPGIVRVP